MTNPDIQLLEDGSTLHIVRDSEGNEIGYRIDYSALVAEMVDDA